MDSIIYSIEQDYSGFIDKVTNTKQKEYFIFLDSLKKAAYNATEFNCYILMRRYLSYFNDPHLNMVFYINNAEKKRRISNLFKNWPSVNINIHNVNKYKNDTLSGIWVDPDNDLEMQIVQRKNEFIGVISKGDSVFWNKGMLKLKFDKKKPQQIDYYDFYHIKKDINYTITRKKIRLGRSEQWYKKEYYKEVWAEEAFQNTDFAYQNINDSVGLFTINSFHIFYKDSIEKLIESSLPYLGKVKYLLFDLRNNGGGHSSIYYKFLQLVFQINTIRTPELYRISNGNIANFSRLLVSKLYPDSVKQGIRVILDSMNLNIGTKTFIAVSKADTLIFSSQYKNIKKIGVIESRTTGSAAEFFISLARKDKRTTLYGEESRGAMNYMDIGGLRVLPCDIFAFYCPMAKQPNLNEHSVFNIGITPDVKIDLNNNKWLNWIILHLTKP
jgi:hypothetical protein